MIGGAADVVIEPNIMRAIGTRELARSPEPEQARLAAELSSDAPYRSGPSKTCQRLISRLRGQAKVS